MGNAQTLLENGLLLKITKSMCMVNWWGLQQHSSLIKSKLWVSSTDELLHLRPNSRDSRTSLLHMEAKASTKQVIYQRKAWVKKTKLLLRDSRSWRRTHCQVVRRDYSQVDLIQISTIMMYFLFTHAFESILLLFQSLFPLRWSSSPDLML